MARLRRRAVRFGLVGMLATAVHVLLFTLLRGLGHVAPTASTVLAFCGALLVSYRFHYAWTFEAHGPHRRHLARFALIAVSGAGLNAAIMHAAVTWLGWDPYAGLAAVILLVPPLSFLANHRWAFGAREA